MKLTRVRGVYAIENAMNGKRYIGSATNLAARRAWHMNALRHGKHHSKHLQRAFNSHGEAAFKFRVLVVCEKKDQLFYEQRLMDGFKSHDVAHGYNMAKNAEAPYGTSTVEGRLKVSAASRSRAKRYDFRGEQLCLTEIAENTGLTLALLMSRVGHHGWDIEKAVTHKLKNPLGKRYVTKNKYRKDGMPRRSKNAVFTHDGKSMRLPDWANEIGCDYSSLRGRLRAGWDFEKAITTPFQETRKFITFNGKTLTMSQWAKEIDIPSQTLSYRISRLGWSAERALTTRPAYYHHPVAI